jgi:hypothetical protein
MRYLPDYCGDDQAPPPPDVAALVDVIGRTWWRFKDNDTWCRLGDGPHSYRLLVTSYGPLTEYDAIEEQS